MHKGRSRTSDVYRVEHLVDKRIRGNRTEYLVKWKNWSDEHNTWEPAKNILDKRLIESYERREKRKKNQLASSSSSTPRDRSHSTESQRSPLHSPERHQQQQQPQPQQHVKSEENLNLNESSSLSPIKSSLASIDPILSTFLPSSRSTGSTGGCCSDLPLISSSQSIKSPHTSSTTTSTDSMPSQWELSELCYDRRFRRTTLLVAAASASAANAAAALAHSRQSGRQAAQHSSTTGSSTGHTTATTTTITPASTIITNTASNTNIISTTASTENSNSTASLQTQSKMTKTEAVTAPLPDENIEARPKIRLTIPRDRILPCPPIGVSSNSSASSANNTSINSSSSSSSNQCLDDSDHSISMIESTSVRHEDVNSSGLFVAPVELPRRCYNTATALSPHSLMNPTGGMRLPDIQIDNRSQLHDYETSKSPKRNKQSPCTNYTNHTSVSSMMQLPKLLISSTNLSSTSPSPSSAVPYDIVISGSSSASASKKRRRQFSSESCLSSPSHAYSVVEHDVVVKKRRHSQKKKDKRKRRHEQISEYQEQQQQHHHRHHRDHRHHQHHGKGGYASSFEEYNTLSMNKIRRRSGSSSASHTSSTSSSSCSSSSASSSSTSSLSPTILSNTISPPNQEEGFPRLAPLRIHLPRSVTSQLSASESCIDNQSFIDHTTSGGGGQRLASCGMNYRSSHTITTNNNSNNSVVIDHNANTSHIQINHSTKRIHLVPEMCITDITVNGLTISIKECSGPRNFFGIPTSQVVQYNSPSSSIKKAGDTSIGDEYTTPTTNTTTTSSTSTTTTTTTSSSAASAAGAGAAASTLNNTTSSSSTNTTSTPPTTNNNTHSSTTRTVKPLCVVSLKEQNVLTTSILSPPPPPASTKLESSGVYQTPPPLTDSVISIPEDNEVDDRDGGDVVDENHVKKNSLEQYADENIAPNVIDEEISNHHHHHRIGGLQLPVPISTSSSSLTSLYPPPSSPSTTTPTIVTITSSSSDSDNHQTHRLSTIYEDTEPSSSLKSEKEETLVESPIKTENVVTSTPPPAPPQPEITSSTTLICPTIDTNLANNSHSTSSLLLAATEAATKSALDSPCSPGLLIFPPPRRSSTPIEHSPAYINQSLMINNTNPLEIDKSINNLVSTSSSDNLTTTTTITISGDNGTVIKSITKSMPSTELCVANFNRKHLNSKATSTITSPSSSLSSPSTRPMATIFGQVRNRNTTTTTTSVLMNNNTSETGSTRKSTGKSKHTTMPSTVSNIWSNSTTTITNTITTMDTLKDASLKPIGRINASHYDDNSIDRNNNNNSNKKCSDPSKIYTFTGESSPTYNLASCCGDDDDNTSSSPLSLTSSPRNTCPFPSSSSSTTTCSDLKHTNANSSKISRSSKHNHHNSGYRNHDSLKCSISSSTPTPPPPLPPLTQPASSFPLSFSTAYINNKTLQQSYLNMPTLLPSDDMLYLMNKQGCCNVGDSDMVTTTMVPTSLSTSTPNSFNYLPNSIANNNVGQCNTEAALAAATCLQQLQMQFMCGANPLAMAAALSALSGGGGGAGAGGGFPTNPPFFPPNMNCPPVRFNFNSDVNTNTPCSTSVGGSGNPANYDWSTSTPFFPNSIDSNLPMVFPNESNFLPPNPSYSTGVNNNSNNNNNNSTFGQFHPMDGYGMMLMMNALKPSVVTSLAGGAAAVIPGRCDYYPVENCCVNTVGDTIGLVSESSDLPIDLSAKR